MRAASQGTVARVRQYLTRATSSRATPSYANGASQRSTPDGGGSAGGARSVRAQASHTGSAGRPHPGHDAGNAASTSARQGFTQSPLVAVAAERTGGARHLRRRGAAQHVLVRRAEDAALGDDRGHEPGRRHVEGAVRGGDAVRCDALTRDAYDFVVG